MKSGYWLTRSSLQGPSSSGSSGAATLFHAIWACKSLRPVREHCSSLAFSPILEPLLVIEFFISYKILNSASQFELLAIVWWRAYNGDVMFSASKKIDTGLAPSIAEASAIYEGMKLVAETGLLPAMVESDSLSVVNLILAGQPIRSEIGLVIEDILKLKVLHGFSSFVFSPRTSYRVAHSLAKMVVTHAMDIVSLEKVPPSIRSLVQEEAIFS
ncbi:hypothetical protein ACOSQ3_016978 [Xanthoceras sorbifolium]